MKYKLFNADCYTVFDSIPKHSVQLILVDPPYGTTPLEWDKDLNFTLLWEICNSLLTAYGVICIFGQEPFSTCVRASNIVQYKYDWYWIKERLTNVFQVKKRPGKVVENIMVFYTMCKYYPQKTIYTGKPVSNKIGDSARFSQTQGSNTKPLEYHDDGTRHPTQVLYYNRENVRTLVHPTQKPVALLQYLIKTYTDKNDIVLDFCMGSGSTGVACMNTHRRFIGIEKDKAYFETAKERIILTAKNITNLHWSR